jgi:hypothetical protein
MDKSSLLTRLARARDRAEKAYLNVVLLTLEAGQRHANGSSSPAFDVRLQMAANEEQKRLKEVEWILDQLDKVE